jgi:hypothetical protein
VYTSAALPLSLGGQSAIKPSEHVQMLIYINVLDDKKQVFSQQTSASHDSAGKSHVSCTGFCAKCSANGDQCTLKHVESVQKICSPEYGSVQSSFQDGPQHRQQQKQFERSALSSAQLMPFY